MEFRRESIFVSGVRSFFNCFTGLLGFIIAIVVVICIITLALGPSSPKNTELTILPDAEGKKELLADTAPVILQIAIDGVIGVGDITGPKFNQILVDSREDFLKNDRVKAILLRMETPGGTVEDSDHIYRVLLEYKERFRVPVYAYVEGMCASGGMYICSAVDKIYASPTSIIGSVGVMMGPFFNFSHVMEKIGIQSLTLTDGKDKDTLNPFRPWKPNEDASLKRISGFIYDRFVNILTQARPMLDKERLIKEYGANVFIAREAQELGYIDVADVGYKTALTDLVAAANIPASTPYQVVELTLPHNLFVELAKGESPLFSGKIKHNVEIPSPLASPELSGKLLYLYQTP
jgi:protease IV